MSRRDRSNAKSFVGALLLVLLLTMFLTPAGAHINDSVDHVWNKHLKTEAQKLFFTKKQADAKFATTKALKSHVDSTVYQPTDPKQSDSSSPGPSGAGADLEVTVGRDGLPTLVYIDNQSAIAVAKCKNPSCTQKTTTVASAIDGTHLDVAMGPNGSPVIAYTAGNLLYMLRCTNATCTRKAPIVPVFEVNGEELDYAAISIQPNGFPIVAAHTTESHDVYVKTCADAACGSGTFTTLQGDGGDDIGKWASLGILGSGVPVIAYYNETDSNPEVAVCSDGCENPSTTVLDIGNWGRHLAMTIGQDGYPMIIFENSDAGLHLWNCNSVDCNSAIQQSLGGGPGAEHNAISVDGNGIPVMVTDDTDPLASEIVFIRCPDPECSSSIQSTRVPMGDAGNDASSITVGPNGLPYVAYRSEITNGPRLVRCANPFCLRHWSRPQ